MLLAPLALLAAQVCDAADFGPSHQDPLVITGVWQVGDGCFLDFGARAVEVRGTLDVRNARLRAAALTVADGGKIVGATDASGTTTLETFVGGGHGGEILILGRVEQNNDVVGGTVLIAAAGAVLIAGGGQVEARGLGADVDGGYVEIVARESLDVDGAATSIDVSGGGRDAAGGTVYLESLRADVVVRRTVDAHGQQGGGGGMEMLAYAGSVTASGTLDLHATGYGDGGELAIVAQTLIRCEGLVNADAGTGTLAYGGGAGGTITFECAREVEILDRIHAQGGVDNDGGELEVSGRDLTLDGAHVMLQATGYGGSGGTLTLDARRDLHCAATVDLGGDDLGFGGSADLAAGGALVFDGDLLARGGTGGDLALTAAGSAAVRGLLDAGGKGGGGAGGTILLDAAGNVDLAGAAFETDGYSASGRGGNVIVRAGPIMVGDAATRLRARGNASNGGAAGSIALTGCRITLPAGSQVTADGATGGGVTIRADDVLTLGGSVRADAGSVTLTTRLDAPWSPLTSGATFAPAPLVVHDRMLSPCLGAGAIALLGPPSVRVGQSFTLAVQSAPHRKLVVSLDFVPHPQPLGPLGWQALDPASALFAADFGHFGPTIAGSRTDAQGAWSWTSPIVPAAFLGRTLHAEAFVLDPTALNGVFHQSPLRSLAVLP